MEKKTKIRIISGVLLATFGFVCGLLLSLPFPVRAADDEAGMVVLSENQGTIENNIDVVTDTGGNTASENDDNGSVSTGDTNVGLNIINDANNSITGLGGDTLGYEIINVAGAQSGNIVLGTGVEAEAAGTPGTAIVVGENSAIIVNNLNITANTGNNQANENGGNGTITTGSANVAINVINMANLNVVLTSGGYIGIVNVMGNWDGNLYLSNTIGLGESDLANNPESCGNCQNPNQVFIITNNNAEIENNILVSAETGKNIASGNGGNGIINTGSSQVILRILNVGNQNIVGGNIVLVLVNVLGNWIGQNLIVSSSFTDEALCEEPCASEKETIDISQNNVLNKNDIQINVNTGGNNASENGDDGIINSGDAGVLVNILNFFNLNIFAERLVLLLVNVTGDWTGDVSVEPNIIDNGDNNEPEIIGGLTIALRSANRKKGKNNNFTYPTLWPFGLSGVVLAETTAEDDVASTNTAEIKGEQDPKTASESSCYWWWILLLIFALLLVINWLLLKRFGKNLTLRYLLLATPAVMGALTWYAHLILKDSLVQTIFCDYLWLLILILVAVFYLVRPFFEPIQVENKKGITVSKAAIILKTSYLTTRNVLTIFNIFFRFG